MLAQHSYLAQGPGDLEFSKGDVLDVLSEGSSLVWSAGLNWGRLLESIAGRDWGMDGLSSAVSGSYCQEVQACAGFCLELNTSHENSC